MRFLAAALAALSLTACLGRGEPLGSTGDRVNEARAPNDSVRALDAVNANRLGNIANLGAPVDEAPPDEPTAPTDPLIAEVAATIDYASLQAFAAADAGTFRDRASAQLAAIELANAAALVQQRANEFHALSSTAGEAGDPCDSEGGVVEGELPSPVDDAVTVSALAAELGAEVADTLDPPSEMVCSGVCGDPCQEVPGTVDEEVLALAVEGVLDAAQDCADLGLELGGEGGAPEAL
jgi:hypothetical protein